jgi:hypothetical protein
MKNIKNLNFEIIVAVALGVMAIAAFFFQATTLDDKTTQKEAALFNIVQFILTIGFAWFSTRAISRAEFENNLRRFAVSAYRRISDIQRMIRRLQSEVSNTLNSDNDVDSSDFRVIEAIAMDTIEVVKSSDSDWADIIGEELLAIEKIRHLEKEKEELFSDKTGGQLKNGNASDLSDIEKQISELSKLIPASLSVEISSELVDDFNPSHAGQWLERQHRDMDGLVLRVVAGGSYIVEGDVSTLTKDNQLFSLREEKGFNVEDASALLWGRILNPTPLKYDQFVSAIEKCYGTKRLSLEFMEVDRTENRDEELWCWYKVKVVSEPIILSRMRHKRAKSKKHLTKAINADMPPQC